MVEAEPRVRSFPIGPDGRLEAFKALMHPGMRVECWREMLATLHTREEVSVQGPLTRATGHIVAENIDIIRLQFFSIRWNSSS